LLIQQYTYDRKLPAPALMMIAMRFRARLFLLSLCLLTNGNVWAATTVTISHEAVGNTAAGRAAAATLDDAWTGSLPYGPPYNPNLFYGCTTPNYSGSKTFSDPASGLPYQVDWQAGAIIGTGPGTPTSTTFNNASTGTVTCGTGNVLQDSAPSPFPTETRLSIATGLTNSSSLSALQLNFTTSSTDVYGFGLFIGDLESRPNNGTVGRILIFDESNVLVSDTPIVYTGSVLNSSTLPSYTVTEALGSPSGPANNNNSTGYWGNQTTAFVSVASDQPIGRAVIHVGDDDHTSNNNGVDEGLGFVGFQLPRQRYDYGDAPASYDVPPAAHIAVGPLLGAARDGELTKGNGAATFDGSQDDSANTGSADDEDGVTFTTPAGGGDNLIASITVNNPSTAATLCAWLDGGGTTAAGAINNAFDNTPDEQRCVAIGTGVSVTPLAWLVSSTTTQTYYARFRVCTVATECQVPTGIARDGEVEDYQIVYNPTRATVGSLAITAERVDEALVTLAGPHGDPAALVTLLAQWDAQRAADLKDADVATLAAALRPYLDPDGDGAIALVRWDTLQEQGTVGFYVERAVGDGWTRLSGGLLPGLIDAPQGGEYWLFDADAKPGAHRYRLVELEAWGVERLHGPWSVQLAAADERTTHRATSATGIPNQAEAQHQWSDWQGLGQGLAARKRLPPLEAQQRQPQAVQAAAVPASGAAWLYTQGDGLYHLNTAQVATQLGASVAQTRTWLRQGKQVALTNAGAPVPWYYDATSDALYFVAQNHRTLSTDQNAYRLTKDNARTLVMDQRVGSGPVAGTASGAFRATVRLEQDLVYSLWSVKDHPEADYWFWDYLYAGTSHNTVTVPLALPGATLSGQGQLRVYLRGWTDFEPGNDHRVAATLNGIAIGAPLEWDGFTTAVLTLPFNQAGLAQGAALALRSEKINVATLKNPGQWLDRIEVDYWREFKAENGQLWLRDLAPGVYTVSGFNNNAIDVIRFPGTAQAVWRRNVTITPVASGWQVSFEALQGGDFFIAERAAARDPVTAIDQPSRLAQSSNRADYLIIAPRSLTQTANALAAYQRVGQKRQVEIAWLDDIYDEFNAGRTEPRAISDFLAHVYRHWKHVPEYVVLLGSGTLDHKNRQGYGDSLLPVRMALSPWGLHVSDNRYGDIDGDHRADYALGRIPVVNDAQGLAYVSKLQAALPGAKQAVVVADNADSGGDFPRDADRQATALQTLGFSVSKLYHPTSAVRAALTQSATWETAYLSYSGHGSPLQLGSTSENFLTLSTAAALSNQVLPIFMAFSCEVGNGAAPGWGGSVAGALTLNPNGGTAAALAPTGNSLNQDAQIIGAAFTDLLIGARMSVGQAAREAQLQSANAVAPFMLDVYQTLGDPATPAR